LPELRKDPVTDRWVIIAADRPRPSEFSRDTVPTPAPAASCPLCPGNEGRTPPEVLAYRDGTGQNQPGWQVRVVPNKYPVLKIEGDLNREGEGLFDKMDGIGAHELIVETPDHTKFLSELSEKQIEDVFRAFRDRINDLKRDVRLRYILVFKNHGKAAGGKLEHSHSQLIALPVVPKRVIEEMEGAKHYYDFKDRCVFCDIVRQERRDQVRVVSESERFLVIEPYAPRSPFETWILPRQHESHFEAIDAAHLQDLSWVMRSTLRKIDKVLEKPPYNFVLHTAPVQEGKLPYYHWHIEIMPKLTKVAGFEWGSGFYINPTAPEESAQFLREAGLG
jgi:UDPglucose--hexose-1-phosphate uridylyltransferase